MSEESVIQAAPASPVTIPSLLADFAALGVQPGMTLLLHSSLSALGWVCGGPVAVILALEQLLGPDGTLVMPTHTGGLSDPAHVAAPAGARIVVADYSRYHAGLRPRPDADAQDGRDPRDVSQAAGRAPQRAPAGSPLPPGAATPHRVAGDHALEYGLGEALAAGADLRSGWLGAAAGRRPWQ